MTTTTKPLLKTLGILASAVAAIALLAPVTAAASGGSYDIFGATPNQNTQIKAALDAGSFPWGVVPGRVRIVVAAGADTIAYPGTIQLDANLVDSGSFAWGVIQHEYAHQVDFYLLSTQARSSLAGRLGGTEWGAGLTDAINVAHDNQSGERFANALAWSFWPSADNALGPVSKTFSAKAFRGYLGALLKPATTALSTPSGLAAIAAPAAAATTSLEVARWQPQPTRARTAT